MCVVDLNQSFSPEGRPAPFDYATTSDRCVIPTNQSAGAYWEERASQLIVSRGVTVIARNYISRFGEIDLIALDSERLALFSVRYRRRAHFGSATVSAFLARQYRVLMTSSRGYCNRHCRFDIITLHGLRGSTTGQWPKEAFG